MSQKRRPHMKGKQFDTYYHGTHSHNVESILKHGLLPHEPGRGSVLFDGDEGDPGHPEGVYVTKNIDEARDYGNVVFELQLDPKSLGYSPETSHEFSTKPIPPSRIKLLPEDD